MTETLPRRSLTTVAWAWRRARVEVQRLLIDRLIVAERTLQKLPQEELALRQQQALVETRDRERTAKQLTLNRLREQISQLEKQRQEQVCNWRQIERYAENWRRTDGLFDRYRAAEPEQRAIIKDAIRAITPKFRGDKYDRRGPPNYPALSRDAKLALLGPYLKIDAADDQFPELVFDTAAWDADCYIYRHPGGPADLAEWRKHLATIRQHIDADRDPKGEFTVELYHDASHVILRRHEPLPDQIPFDIDLLRRGEVFYGYDLVRREPLYAPLADLTHTLVCGQNGEGKSTLLNTVLLSLLYNADLIDSLTLVDLKGGIELARYQGLLPGKIGFIDRIEEMPALCTRLRAIMDSRLQRLRAERKVKAERGFHFVIIDEYAPIQLQKPSRDDPVDYRQMHDDLLLLATQGRAPGIKLWAQLQQPVDAMMATAFRSQLRSIVCFKVPALNAGIVFDGATDFPVRPSELPPYQCIVALRNEPKRLVKAPYIPADIDLAAIVAAGARAAQTEGTR